LFATNKLFGSLQRACKITAFFLNAQIFLAFFLFFYYFF